MQGERKRSFPPVIDEQVRLLILGSLPGDASLAQDQYYAHRQNRFWQLMSDVIQLELPSLAYPLRLQALLERGIGLWDVIAEARRAGSLDSQIRQQTSNDLTALLTRLPHLQAIAFNGATAARLGQKVLHASLPHYHFINLPSSSSAYTLPYHEKLKTWLILKDLLRSK